MILLYTEGCVSWWKLTRTLIPASTWHVLAVMSQCQPMSPEPLTALVNECGADVHGHGWETSEDSQSHNPTKKLHPSAYCSLCHQHWVTVPFLDHYHLTSFSSGVRNTYCVVPRMVAGGARDTCLYCSLVVAVSRIPGKKAERHVNLKMTLAK